VTLKSVVKNVDALLGRVSLGTVLVDYTPLLSADPMTAPQAGQTFEAAGIQPIEKGVVIARPNESGAVGCSNSDGRM
jgi:hypothetical protein